MILTGETQVLGEKPVPFAHSPPEASKGRRQMKPGSRYGWQATATLSCTYLEEFRKSTKFLQLNQVRKPIGPGYESDASYSGLPSSFINTRTGTFLECSWVSSYRIVGLDILNKSMKCPRQNFQWSGGGSKLVSPEPKSVVPDTEGRHRTLGFLGLCK